MATTLAWSQCIRKRIFIVIVIFGLGEAQETTRIPVGGQWRLECPKAGFRANDDRLSVTWTQNNAIWLKIERSNVTISQQLVSMYRSRVGSSNILNVSSNNFRYKFYYDEMIGVYELAITRAAIEDSGLWACYVTVERKRLGRTEEISSDGFLVVGDTTPPSLIFGDWGENENDDDGSLENGGNQQGNPKEDEFKPSEYEPTTSAWNITGNWTSSAISHHHFNVVLLLTTTITAGNYR